MHPLIIAQYMAAAAFFTVAVMHSLVWSQRGSRSHLLFALTAMAAGCNAIAEACIYQAASIEAIAPALRWYVNMSGLWAVSLVWFIVSYTGLGRLGRWLAALLTVELSAALIVNWPAPGSFIYKEITGLREVTLPWGETISLATGVARSWPLAAELTALAALTMAVDGSLRFWRDGQRSRAWLFGLTITVFIALYATHATLVDMGVLNSPYLSTYGFLGVVLVIGYDMATDVVRASLLSEELRRKDADLRSAVDQERNRIAGDLHDSVTQTLFSTAAIADALPEVWDRYPDEARQGLVELRQLTKGALAEMRTMLLELHPTELLEKQLDELLRQLAAATEARSRIHVSVEICNTCSLPQEVQVALYRVAQEALNNVVKHAQATAATLVLECNDDTAELAISDDGQGFDPQVVDASRLGLRIMRRRVGSVGANLSIEPHAGKGTTIRVIWRGDGCGGPDG